MPACPDCGADNMKKHAPFYVCQLCGLSFTPYEIEKAQRRARKDLKDLGEAPDEERDQRRRERRNRSYKKWLEGSIEE